MLFEVGKYYKHASGEKIHIMCEAKSDIYVSPCFVAESNEGELSPVGTDEENAVYWTEITYEEWRKK